MAHHIKQYRAAFKSDNEAKQILLDIGANLSKIINVRGKDPNILQLEETSVTLTINERKGWRCALTLHEVEEGFQLKLDLLPANWGEDSYCIEEPHLGSDVNGAEGLILVYRFFLAIIYHEINRFGLFQDGLAHPDIINLMLDTSKSIKVQFEEFDELEKFNQDYENREFIRDAFSMLCSDCLQLDLFSKEMAEILDQIEKNSQDNTLEMVD